MKIKFHKKNEYPEVDMTTTVEELTLKYIGKQSRATNDIDKLQHLLSITNSKGILFVWFNVIKLCATYKAWSTKEILDNNYNGLSRKKRDEILDRCNYTADILKRKSANFQYEFAKLKGVHNPSLEKVHARFGIVDDFERSFEELTMKFFNKRYSLPNNSFTRCMENRQAPVKHL